MSCVTRCPRKNGPGLVIMALRNLSVKMGYFTESERGRQIFPLSRILNGNILKYGYCVHPDSFKYEDHPESGPVYEWHLAHRKEVYERLGANYNGEGSGTLRKISQKDLDELKAIFDVTGGTQRMEMVEKKSLEKAKEMGMDENEYFKYTFEHCSQGHFNE